MAEGQVVLHVARPPEQVWPHLIDLEGAPDWVPDLVSVERLTAGDVAVGTRFRQVVSFSGVSTVAEFEVTRCETARVFAQEGEGGPGRFSATFTLEPADGGTRLTHAWSLGLEGPMRMMEPMVRGWVERNAETATANLKRRVESGDSCQESR